MAKRPMTRKQAIRAVASEFTRSLQCMLRAWVEGDKAGVQEAAKNVRFYTDIIAGRRGMK